MTFDEAGRAMNTLRGARANYARKPSWAGDGLPKATDEQRAVAVHLPIFTCEEVMGRVSRRWKDFIRPMPQFFVMVCPTERILVDTQGFNYVRYAARL